MRRLVISTLSSLVPVEIKRAFQDIQAYFNQVNNEGGVTTNDNLTGNYYSKTQADGKYEVKSNKVTSLSGTSTDIQYPSAKLTYDQLALKENLVNKVTSISGASTNTQYPSAKLLYDQLALKVPFTVLTDWKDPTGWVNPDGITRSYDSTTRKITLAGDLRYYWRGVLTTLSSPWVSDAHSATTGVNYYLSSSDGTTFTWATTVWAFDYIMVAFVNYGASNKFAVNECHSLMPHTSHEEDHDTLGTYRKSGGTLSAYVLSSTTAADRRPAVSQTVLKDEDLSTTLAALAAGSYTLFFLSSANTPNFTLASGDIVPLSGNRPYWNEFTGGAWQQTLMSANSYMTVWLVGVPVTDDAGSQSYRYWWIQGQSNGSLASETALFPNNLTTTAIPAMLTEFNFIAKVLIKYVANWTIEAVTVLYGTRQAQIATGGGGGGISDAPVDGEIYVRRNGAWEILNIA